MSQRTETKPHRKDDLKMSREDDDFKHELTRMTSPEVRLTELIEKLSQRIEVNDQESRQREEENQRNINFILGQQAQFSAGQAQFSADMQQLREAQARAEQKWENTANGINALLAIAELHNQEIQEIKELAKAQAEAQAEAQARTDRQMAETDERLNALVNVVEKMISDKRNGG